MNQPSTSNHPAPLGILSYGSYVPRYRITAEAIGAAWHQDGVSMGKGLKVSQKSVPHHDEDSATIGVEAARRALAMGGVAPEQLGALYCGSESKVYAVKPNATLLASALGIGPLAMAGDIEFACKAGTAAIQTVASAVAAGWIEAGLAVGADTAQGRPGDVLEYTAAAGGAAFVLGRGEGVIARLVDTVSVVSDTPDFWRTAHAHYPVHAGRFTGEPSYQAQIQRSVEAMLTRQNAEPGDFDHAIFHTPNGKFPRKIAKKLGFSPDQLAAGLVVDEIGNTYSGASLLALCAVLDQAQPGQRILMVSYGSGAGSDAFVWEVKPAIEGLPRERFSLRAQMSHTVEVDYPTYRRWMEATLGSGE